jgi:hypothetical protein
MSVWRWSAAPELQHLYFCTSKASKPSRQQGGARGFGGCLPRSASTGAEEQRVGVSICTFVLVKQRVSVSMCTLMLVKHVILQVKGGAGASGGLPARASTASKLLY